MFFFFILTQIQLVSQERFCTWAHFESEGLELGSGQLTEKAVRHNMNDDDNRTGTSHLHTPNAVTERPNPHF